MADIVFYPAVTLVYFFAVMRSIKQDRLILNDSASANVFCLFVIAQPLCLLLSGYTGMLAFLLTCSFSYQHLPWKEEQESKKTPKGKKKHD